MIKLSDLELPLDLFWQGRHNWAGVASKTEYALSGHEVLWQSPKHNRPIVLEAGESYGWLTYAQVKTLQDMAMVIGAVYQLYYDGEVLNVRFNHEDKPLDMTPIRESSTEQEGDFYYGTISLVEV